MLPVADGSDYMGSLRNPAAWNNVFGFRPSRGRVPSLPEHATRSSRPVHRGSDGPRVLDVALLLGTQAGEDLRVPLSLTGRLDELADVASARAALAAATRRAVSVGWLADLGGHLAFEAGILDVCADGRRRLGALGAASKRRRSSFDLDELWSAWLVWRHLSSAAGSVPPPTDEPRRALIKPEALWEIDRSRSLTVDDIAARVGGAHPLRPRDPRAVRRLRRAGAPDRPGVAVPGRAALAARSAAGRWTPTTGGWRSPLRDVRRASRRSACPPASTTAACRWACS